MHHTYRHHSMSWTSTMRAIAREDGKLLKGERLRTRAAKGAAAQRRLKARKRTLISKDRAAHAVISRLERLEFDNYNDISRQSGSIAKDDMDDDEYMEAGEDGDASRPRKRRRNASRNARPAMRKKMSKKSKGNSLLGGRTEDALVTANEQF